MNAPRSILLGLLLGGSAPNAMAQSGSNPSLHYTRAQVEATIAEAQKIVSSPGYSSRLKQIKRQEIRLLKARLEEGDLQPGDQIVLSVQGEQTLSSTFTVSGTHAITLPGIADVSLKGVLRSELEEHLTREISKYLRNPIVHVQTTVRLSLLGSVGKPGFYQIQSDKMIGDAIMEAGGPGNGVDPANSHVERAGTIIMDKEAFAEALHQGRTLDQMNLRAGDEIIMGGGRTPGRNFWGTALPVITGIASFTWMLVQVVP